MEFKSLKITDLWKMDHTGVIEKDQYIKISNNGKKSQSTKIKPNVEGVCFQNVISTSELIHVSIT